jgi:hypothetical protein
VQVFLVDERQVREVDVTRFVRRDLARRFPPCMGIPAGCFADGKFFAEPLDWVNVYAFHWVEGSRRLLLAAGVPPSSGYGRNMGTVVGYVVEVPSGKILSVYSERDFANTWQRYIGAFVVGGK